MTVEIVNVLTETMPMTLMTTTTNDNNSDDDLMLTIRNLTMIITI